MFRSRSLSCVVRLRRHWIFGKQRTAVCGLLLLCLLLVACSGFGGGGNTAGSTPTSSPAPAQMALNQLHWCKKPLILFRDEGVSTTSTATSTPLAASATPQTLTDWGQIEPELSFSVYLPTTLLSGTCLVSALGTVHDPILGSSFTIAYVLPDHSPMSFSEGPLGSQSPSFQCSPSSGVPQQGVNAKPSGTPVPLQVCSGARNTTNITLSASGSTDSLQQLFSALQPHVDWVPNS